MNKFLGRKAHDPVLVGVSPEVKYSIVAPPPDTLIRDGINFLPQPWGNDNNPDCTVAGLLNGALAGEALSTGGALAIDPLAWQAFYAACAGVVNTPEAIEASDGAVMLDVLRSQGAGNFDIGLEAPLTGNFGRVGMDRTSVARVLVGMGWTYAGVMLSQADVDASGVWQAWATPGAKVGGHCFVPWGYTGFGDGDTVIVASWGGFVNITWARWDQIIEENYAVLFGVTEPAGVDVVGLAQANAEWLGQ